MTPITNSITKTQAKMIVTISPVLSVESRFIEAAGVDTTKEIIHSKPLSFDIHL